MPWPLHQQQMDRHRIAGMQDAGCVKNASTGISPHLPTAPQLPYTFIKQDENSFVIY